MHNIKYIRNNPKQFEKLMKRRGISLNSSEILDIDIKELLASNKDE